MPRINRRKPSPKATGKMSGALDSTANYHQRAQQFINSAKSKGQTVKAEGGELISYPKGTPKATPKKSNVLGGIGNAIKGAATGVMKGATIGGTIGGAAKAVAKKIKGYKKGGKVKKTQVAKVHKGERVLNKKQAKKFEKVKKQIFGIKKYGKN